jgi:hypothetical protein
MKEMNVFFAVLFFSCPLFSQTQPAPVLAACGDSHVGMVVDLDKAQHSVAQPEPGKALIYFIQDGGLTDALRYVTTEIGIDGKWVGANRRDSYFAVAVEPGEHHLCAEIQALWAVVRPELIHFTAETGRIYYFRTRLQEQYLSLTSADSDEARYLISSSSLATAHAKK